MKPSSILTSLMAASALILAAGSADAAKKPEPPAPLTETGEAHLKEYTAMLEGLKAEIVAALPKIDEAKLAAYHKARAAEVAAVAEHERCRKGAHQISEWKRHIGDFETKWIPMAEDELKKAKEALKTAEDKEAAQAAVEKAEKNLEKTKAGIPDRQAKLKRDLELYPNVDDLLKKAEVEQPRAEAAALAAAKDLGLGAFLASDKLDHKLATCHIIAHATPRGLAEYTQQGSAQKQLIDELLANGPLCLEMAIADGAKDGKYGKALEILQAIHSTSSKSKSDPTLKNLALGIALEHAVPCELRNAKAEEGKAPEFVDPVKRYLAYEKAFQNKELDPCFDNLSAWDMRMVVDGEEPDEIAAWGRQMLSNYRPDHILTEDERWRYVDLVRSDIRYGSHEVKFDQDDLQFFQNILRNGGICGRRAFLGRFILRAHGVPCIARSQPGHAALAHYTSDGWVVCLGAAWGKGGTHGRGKDTDFLATTQIRAMGKDFMQIARAQWIGSAHGEGTYFGFESHREEIPFWNAISFYTQRDLLSKAGAKTLAAVGEDISEANVTKEKVEIIKVELHDDDKQVKVATNGTITIPAAATSNLSESTPKVIFMPSNQGGLQLHYSRTGDPQPLEYTFEAPKAGKYALTAKVCTPSWKQHLHISANGSDKIADLELPHTVGMWETTAPVTIELKAGKNVLTMNHQADGYAKGFSIHQFVLTPAK